MNQTEKDKLNIAALALDIEWANPQANILAVQEAARLLPADTDVLVLPELFTTAFVQDKTLLSQIAAEYGDTTIETIKALAYEHDMAIAGSITTVESVNIFNHGFFIEPSGKTSHYNKRHLFSLSAESDIYSQGLGPIPIINYKGWNIALMVCYDLRFPVWARNSGHAYDMMLVPANWPQARGYAWSHLLIARAIENQAVYVGANRSGTDDYGCYDGLTEIYDAMGKPIGSPIDGFNNLIVASPSLTEVRKARRKLPTVDSADAFILS